MKISMIGLGKLGLPCATVMSTRYAVTGYDLDSVQAPFPLTESIEDCIESADMIFVAVPTPHEERYGGDSPTSHLVPKDFDYSIVRAVLEEIAEYRTESQTVILISTVLPGTVRREFAQIIPDIVYNPYLIAVGTVAEDFVHPEMIMIGHENNLPAVKKLQQLYNNLTDWPPRYEIGSWEDAESMKIFYNTFISTKIGLVNMILDVADKIGHMNVDHICGALADSTMRIMGRKYMTPGMGDGGACHPRDNIALRWLAKELDLGYDLFGAVMSAREAQAENMARRLCVHGLPVVIMGQSYKKDIPNIDGSYSLLVGYYAEGMTDRVYYLDPLNDLNTVPDEPCVFLVSYHHEWVKEFDAYPPGSIIVDPWRSGMKVEGCRVINVGSRTV